MTNIDYIFDFDCTITYRNFYYLWNRPLIFKKLYPNILNSYINDISNKFNNNNIIKYDENFNNLIFGSNNRLRCLYNFFDYLSKKGNLIISSSGNKDKIYDCLLLNNLGKYFKKHNIYGIETNKTELIMSKFKQGNKVFYIDDNHKEHSDLLRYIKLLYVDDNFKVYGYNSCIPNYIFCHLLDKDGNGINQNIMNLIMNYV